MPAGIPPAPAAGEGDVAAAKRAMRAALRLARDALSEHDRHAASTRICDRLLAHLDSRPVVLVASYAPFGSELDTMPFNAGVQTRGIGLALPRIERDPKRLSFFRVRDLRSDLVPGPWGIPEPDPMRCPRVEYAEVGGWLVPGIAFDRAGRRLGYGGGYYDRVLAGASGWRVAGAVALQIVEQVPACSHDLTMDFIATEDEAWSVRSS